MSYHFVKVYRPARSNPDVGNAALHLEAGMWRALLSPVTCVALSV